MKKQATAQFFSLLIPFCVLLLSSCQGIKAGTSTSGNSLYASFYVGDGSMQYFVKPLRFRSPQSKDRLIIDFTFQQGHNARKNALANFTWFSDTVDISSEGTRVDGLILQTVSTQAQSTEIVNLFTARSKKSRELRQSVSFPLKAVTDFMFQDRQKIAVVHYGKKLDFKPLGKTKRAFRKLKEREMDFNGWY